MSKSCVGIHGVADATVNYPLQYAVTPHSTNIFDIHKMMTISHSIKKLITAHSVVIVSIVKTVDKQV